MALNNNVVADLQARGLIAQMTSEEALVQHLNESRTLYCGFDPTADSLHIGSLVPLLTLRRFQQAGHKPIALVGGATGLIGDPSFKTQERQLNTPDLVAGWTQGLKDQIARFIDFDDSEHSAAVVNNLDWMQNINVLDFLRDVGKHFSVNGMIKKESVKQRLEREETGISFTEFSYMLLQSYDFAELLKQHNCTLQIGGSDQWGNIVGGVDLSRRLYGGQTYGLTLPLVTKADGMKFCKTEAGTIWLNPEKTSPYAFYQFWLSTADADVYRFLRYFTFLDIAEIDAIEEVDKNNEGKPQAQRILAEEVTRLVHGEQALTAAQRITESLFQGNIAQLTVTDLQQLEQDGLPVSRLDTDDLVDKPLTSLLVESGLAKSGKQVKDALSRQAIWINSKELTLNDNMSTAVLFTPDNALQNKWFITKLGKKNYHLFILN